MTYRDYAVLQLKQARLKESEAPASAQAHEDAAMLALLIGAIPSLDEINKFYQCYVSPLQAFVKGKIG